MTKEERRDDSLTMRLPSRLKHELETLAERWGISVADIIVPFLPAVIDGAKRRRRHEQADDPRD